MNMYEMLVSLQTGAKPEETRENDMANKDFKPLVRELRQQGWTVEKTTQGHWKAVPLDPKQGIVHFSESSDYHAMKNTVRDLKARGFQWPPPSKKEERGRDAGVASQMIDTAPDSSDMEPARPYTDEERKTLETIEQVFGELAGEPLSKAPPVSQPRPVSVPAPKPAPASVAPPATPTAPPAMTPPAPKLAPTTPPAAAAPPPPAPPPPAPPPEEDATDRIYRELREAKAYAKLAEEHLQECEEKLKAAQRERDLAANESQKAAKELGKKKSEFDKAFSSAA